MKKAVLMFLFSAMLLAQTIPEWRTWAPTPPMGWNSYDAYHAAITEKQFREIVDVMAEKYLPYGYNYVVIDYFWFHPGPEGWDPENNWETFDPILEEYEDGTFNVEFTMDEWGRVLPSPNRFPSAADGRGFKPLADYVHSKGLKFGIHIIRGIPKQAVARNLPIKGASYRARDIAGRLSRSQKNAMDAVDITKPGAQAYYNSLFNLYAEWDVDFIKADDIMKPFYHGGEIEMMHRGIVQSGRPMVFSLSWGEAPLSYAHHITSNANMWRISGDFWDRWHQVDHMFDLCAEWAPFIAEGLWPDADMLPLGNLRLGGFPGRDDEHMTRLTHDEILSMMSLWAIARSPLMWGGDPLSTPVSFDQYLLNKEVIAVNQASASNREVLNQGGKRVWIAEVPDSEDYYLGLFNLNDESKDVLFDFFWEKLHHRKFKIRDLWAHEDLGVFEEKFERELPAHGAGLYRLICVE